MGGGVTRHVTYVVTNSCPSEAHPVGHLRAEKLAAGRNFISSRVCIAFHNTPPAFRIFSLVLERLSLIFSRIWNSPVGVT